MSGSIVAIAAVFIRHGDALFVLGARGGTLADIRPLGVFTPDWVAVQETSQAMQARVRHAAEVGQLDSESLRELEDHGAFLFDELVPFELKQWLQRDRGTFTLSLSAELLDIPWELLYTGRDVLCHAWAMGRLLQHCQDRVTPDRDLGMPPRVLIVADPDGGLDASYEEGIALKRHLDARHDVTLRAADVDASFIRRHARAYDLLHFAGHVDEHGWRMADGPFTRADAERLVGGVHVPRMVFINGCGGVNTGPNQTVDAWIRAGVEHVIGPLYAVPDRLGRDFTRPFYALLSSGVAIGEAVRQTRLTLATTQGGGATAWGSYVLYGDPRGNPLHADVSAMTTPTPRRVAATRAPTRLRKAGVAAESEPTRATSALASPVETGPRPAASRDGLAFAAVLAAILFVTLLASAAIERDADARFRFATDDNTPGFHEP